MSDRLLLLLLRELLPKRLLVLLLFLLLLLLLEEEEAEARLLRRSEALSLRVAELWKAARPWTRVCWVAWRCANAAKTVLLFDNARNMMYVDEGQSDVNGKEMNSLMKMTDPIRGGVRAGVGTVEGPNVAWLIFLLTVVFQSELTTDPSLKDQCHNAERMKTKQRKD
jgi:hypothetical protein